MTLQWQSCDRKRSLDQRELKPLGRHRQGRRVSDTLSATCCVLMQHQHAIGAYGFEAAATSGSPPQLSFRTIRQQFRRALSAAATRQQLCDGTTASALCNTCACGSAFSAISDSQRRAACSTYSSPAALHLRRFPHATSATHRHSLSATAVSASEGSSSLQSWGRQLDLHCRG